MGSINELNNQKLLNHPNILYFFLYALAYMSVGEILMCLGPMFPYLSEKEGRLETEYSFLFSARAIGIIAGSFLTRMHGKKFTFHGFMIIGVIILSFFSILFTFTSNLYLKGFYIGLSSIGASILDITLNISALECFKGPNVATWMQIIHACFGVGGLLGPIIVYLFELHTLTILGLFGFLLTIPLHMLKTPELLSCKSVEADEKPSENVEAPKNKEIYISKLSLYLISACFFFASGQSISYSGWISSYAVLNGFSTKEHATFYSSLYWVSITIFRMTLAFYRSSSSSKIKYLALVGVGSSFISQFLTWNVSSEVGIIFMTLTYGLCASVLFPLLLTIPEEFGYKLRVEDSSFFIIWAALGEGLLAVVTGKIMDFFSYDWLIYCILMFNVAIYMLNNYNTRTMKTEMESYRESNSLNMLLKGFDKNDIEMTAVSKPENW